MKMIVLASIPIHTLLTGQKKGVDSVHVGPGAGTAKRLGAVCSSAGQGAAQSESLGGQRGFTTGLLNQSHSQMGPSDPVSSFVCCF